MLAMTVLTNRTGPEYKLLEIDARVLQPKNTLANTKEVPPLPQISIDCTVIPHDQALTDKYLHHR